MLRCWRVVETVVGDVDDDAVTSRNEDGETAVGPRVEVADRSTTAPFTVVIGDEHATPNAAASATAMTAPLVRIAVV